MMSDQQKAEKQMIELFTFMVNQFTEIAVVFDTRLNYLAINKNACRMLKKKPEELLGHNMLVLYPEYTASSYHRNLLKAASGKMVLRSLEKEGSDSFKTTYKPIILTNELKGVFVKAEPLDAPYSLNSFIKERGPIN